MLSDEQIREHWNNYSPTKGIESFARAIEAAVRKQEDALIRQMLETLDDGSEHTAQCITNYYIRPCDCKKVTTISAARARLENA